MFVLVKINGDWLAEGYRPIVDQQALNKLLKSNNNCAWITC